MNPSWLTRALLAGAVAVLTGVLFPVLGVVPLFLVAWILWWPVRSAPEGRAVLAVLLLFLVLWILHQLRWVVYPLLAGMLLAYILDPFVDRLERIRCPRALAAGLALLTLVLVFALFLIVLVPTIVAQLEDIVDKAPGVYTTVREAVEPWLVRFDLIAHQGEQPAWLEQAREHFQSILKAAFGGALQVTKGVSRVVSTLGMVFLTPVLAFYLLVDWDRLKAGIRGLLPPRWRTNASMINRDIQQVLPRFVRGQLIVAGVQGVLFVGGFYLAELPNALALGILAGIFTFVPVVGFWATILLVGLSALIGPDPWITAAKVAGVLAVVQVLEGHVLVPRIQGNALGLHPLSVLLAVLCFGILFGFMGVIFAVPTLGVVQASLPRLRTLYENSTFFNEAAPKEAGEDRAG